MNAAEPVSPARTPRRAWAILTVAVLAYAIAVFQRASLGVAGVEAERRFATTAAVLALFGVLQLAVYAALQVPVGIVLDRVGSRRLIAAGAVLMGGGQVVLATAHNVGLGIAARVLVGAGDAIPVLAIVGGTVLAWSLVLAWPGRAPLAVLVGLVVVLASNGPGSLMGFDYARTENESERIGTASGIVNVGGFCASLLTIAFIGIVLSLSSGSGTADYTLHDFKLAFSVQYVLWAVGLLGVLRNRRRLRAARGIRLDAFPHAVVRVWRRRGAGVQ